MYKQSLPIVSTLVGPSLRLTVPWLFRAFQDAAIIDAENIGYGHEKTNQMGLLWVFSRVYVRFGAMPKYLSTAQIETHSGEKKAFFFPRYATLWDEQGNVAAEISSIWALIHEDTRRVEMRPNLPSVNQTNGTEIPLPGKVVQKPCALRYSRKIEYADLDLNGHLNNVRYIEMLTNLHPASFFDKWQFKELLIQYESEIREGETVDIYSDEECTYVRGVVGDRIAFEAQIKYGLIEEN
ncbi:MAG: hypothetical protein K6E59_03575 [Bacilli bacterium]|nr:hypothetical protein [Bacilli bacterium]